MNHDSELNFNKYRRLTRELAKDIWKEKTLEIQKKKSQLARMGWAGQDQAEPHTPQIKPS